MRALTDRQEIAKYINIKHTPVVAIDVATDEIKGLAKIGAVGCYRAKDKVKVMFDNLYDCGEICYFSDTHKIIAQGEAICLHASFGYHDVEEMIKNSHAVELKENSEVIVVLQNSAYRLCLVFLCKTTKANRFCQTLIEIEGDFEKPIKALEGLGK